MTKERSKWDKIFEELSPNKDKITGSVAKREMIKSRLPNPVLAKVWRLADVDSDGMLDSDEFALAMHLINVKLEGYDLPDELPVHLVCNNLMKMRLKFRFLEIMRSKAVCRTITCDLSTLIFVHNCSAGTPDDTRDSFFSNISWLVLDA